MLTKISKNTLKTAISFWVLFLVVAFILGTQLETLSYLLIALVMGFAILAVFLYEWFRLPKKPISYVSSSHPTGTRTRIRLRSKPEIRQVKKDVINDRLAGFRQLFSVCSEGGAL